MDPYHLRAFPGAAALQPAPAVAPAPAQPCQCPPPCPVCGGLECLCRPRFFAGQLLHADDLNRLERYVIEKNKLHNRYLHGWGVVCGLEVLCHPCPGFVWVRSGYALSPCGEDIIVCRDEQVNVCDLISRCRPPVQPMDCEPPRAYEDPACKELVEEWILAVCYEEKPSRGITALQGGSGAACCSRCACGGSSSCGCGCHSSTGKPAKSNGNGNGHGGGCGCGCGGGTTTVRNPPAQCEPTLTCEGYYFTAYKAPPKDPVYNQEGNWGAALQNDPLHAKIPGELGQHFTACVSLFLNQWSQFPQGQDQQAIHNWSCQTKAALLDFFSQQGTTQCDLYLRVQNLVCPVPSQDQIAFNAQWQQFQNEVTAIGGQYAHHCLCSALLPPCPEPATSDCVPLASVKVRKTPTGCEIVDVCNWGPRRFVVTFPHLGYWLSPFQIIEALRTVLEGFCCGATYQPGPQPGPQDPAGVPGHFMMAGNLGGAAMDKGANNAIGLLFSEAFRGTQHPVNGQTMLLAALGATDPQGQAYASQLDLAQPLQALLMHQVVKPTLEAVLPAEGAALLGALSKGGEAAGAPAEASVREEVTVLRGLVAELQRTVAAQGQEIQRLRDGG